MLIHLNSLSLFHIKWSPFVYWTLQQIAFKNLVQRNRQNEQQNQGPPALNSTIQLPFIIINTSRKTVIDCSISSDKWVGTKGGVQGCLLLMLSHVKMVHPAVYSLHLASVGCVQCVLGHGAVFSKSERCCLPYSPYPMLGLPITHMVVPGP